jgi:hypothetical protein
VNRIFSVSFIDKPKEGGKKMSVTQFKKGEANFLDLQDVLNVSRNKLRFVNDYFTLQSPDREPEISEEASSGMAAIIGDVEDEIKVVMDELDAMTKRTFAAQNKFKK